MLAIKNPNGVDLSASPPRPLIYRAGGLPASVTVDVRVIEDDPYLPGQWVTASLDWNDGSLPITSVAESGTLAITDSREFGPGDYVVSVSGKNYRAPVTDQVRVNFPVTVIREATRVAPRRLIYGPILPRDNGFPNASQWNFDTESDILILESSVRMLMLTAKGERLMEPEYGTNIRRILFEQNIAATTNAVQEEVLQALALWEPRLQLQFISVQKTDSTTITVTAAFLSRLSAQGFDVNLEFVK